MPILWIKYQTLQGHYSLHNRSAKTMFTTKEKLQRTKNVGSRVILYLGYNLKPSVSSFYGSHLIVQKFTPLTNLKLILGQLLV